MSNVSAVRPAASAGALQICIAIPTYRRPEPLQRLLDGIAALFVPRGCDIAVLVMDNDAAQSARSLVGRRAADFPFALSYAHVAQPGLSSVRNFALGHATERFDFLAMIDDDEVPQPEWLVELVRVQQATRADAVVGPVPQIVPGDAPHWLREGGFFDLPVHTDEAFVTDGYSGNCLLRMASIERLGVGFDPTLNLAGGEDLMFFRELLGRGAKLAYAAAAVAAEWVAPERLNAAYVLKLNFRRGNTLALCDRRLNGGARTLGLRAVKAAGRVLRGCATALPLALVRGRAGALRAVCDVAHGAGGVAGLLGHTYEAYRRPQRASV